MTSWAVGDWPQEQLLSYVAPEHPADREPSTAVVDWWTAPPLALTAGACDQLVALAETVRASWSQNGSYHDLDPALEPGLRDALIARVHEANDQWWRLDIDTWFVAAKRYLTGEEHPPHMDWVPRWSATRKIVGAWQLSSPDAYGGGDVVVTYGPHRVTVARDRGTFYALPCWTTHQVDPVTTGERWSLIVNGYGPPLR